MENKGGTLILTFSVGNYPWSNKETSTQNENKIRKNIKHFTHE